jgi:starch synthase
MPEPKTEVPMRIVMAAMEMAPVAKVGGLADSVEGMAGALAERGHDVMVVLPGYSFLLDGTRPLGDLPLDRLDPPQESGRRPRRVRQLLLRGYPARVLLLDDPLFRDREGIYLDPDTGLEYPDAPLRYLGFARGVLDLLAHIDGAPDVLHVHDYHTAILPVLLARVRGGKGLFAATRSVLSLHNLGYQGVYAPSVLEEAGIGGEETGAGEALAWGDDINLLKGGILRADAVTTVSPRYAKEILSGPEYGMGLEGVLASRKDGVVGILNGIDTRVWDPSRDAHLPTPFDRGNPGGKVESRGALLARTGLDLPPRRPLLGMVSRLVDQKGIDLIRDGMEALLDLDVGLVVLGSGDPAYQEFFTKLATTAPDRVAYRSGFDDPFAHLVLGGADVLLMPSRYEPCGITQMLAMRYGTVPVVRETGGLADTVEAYDPERGTGTGFLFGDYSVPGLLGALARAVAAFEDPDSWAGLVERAMSQRFGWEEAGIRYEALYRSLIPEA